MNHEPTRDGYGYGALSRSLGIWFDVPHGKEKEQGLGLSVSSSSHDMTA